MKKTTNNPLKGKKEIAFKRLEKILSGADLQAIVDIFTEYLEKNRSLAPEKIRGLFARKVARKDMLPVSIFDNRELSCLEAIVKYLKEELNLRYHDIALMLNRDDRTIWATYHVAVRKRKQPLEIRWSVYQIPISIFTDRRLSVLESIVSYLRDNFSLRYSQISVLLNRDERNVWTVYSRVKEKNNV